MQRSAIPKVIGILMIIFGSLGILGGILGMFDIVRDPPAFRHVAEWQSWKSISHVLAGIGAVFAVFELVVGIQALGYKPRAPKLAVIYALFSIALRLTESVIVFAWVKPAMEHVTENQVGSEAIGAVFGVAMVFGTIIGLAWPITVLALMTRKSARDACSASAT